MVYIVKLYALLARTFIKTLRKRQLLAIQLMMLCSTQGMRRAPWKSIPFADFPQLLFIELNRERTPDRSFGLCGIWLTRQIAMPIRSVCLHQESAFATSSPVGDPAIPEVSWFSTGTSSRRLMLLLTMWWSMSYATYPSQLFQGLLVVCRKVWPCLSRAQGLVEAARKCAALGVKNGLVPVLTKGFRPMRKNTYVLGNGDASSWGRSGETFLFCVLKVSAMWVADAEPWGLATVYAVVVLFKSSVLLWRQHQPRHRTHSGAKTIASAFG